MNAGVPAGFEAVVGVGVYVSIMVGVMVSEDVGAEVLHAVKVVEQAITITRQNAAVLTKDDFSMPLL